MEIQIANRLKELQAEYQKGQQQLAALEKETTNIQTSLLRISGAIQVLEELLETSQQPAINQEGKSNGIGKITTQ
ncbi:MAG: hypothetical protein KTR30_30845 [Saprospiraceae bacterium]|nr:hypothetical protein [Saprospiraceae bacterium]